MSGQQITWKELFDLTNDAEIKSAISQIMKLNKEYTNLAKNLTTQSQHIDKAYKEVSDETKNLTKNTAKLTKEQKEQTDQLVKQGKATDEAFKKAKNLAQAKQNAIAVEKKFGNSVDSLNAKLKAQVLEINTLNTKTKEGAARAKELGASTRKLRGDIKDVTDVTRKLNNAFDRTGKSYDALTKKNNKLKAQLRALPDGMNKASKAAQRLRNQISQNTAKLKQFDKAIGDNFRNVGNYKNAISGAGASLKSFALQLAATTLGLMALFQATKQGFQSFVDFEFTMTSVKALSGATQKEFEKLEKQALELGSTTSNTAGDVAQLQLELTKLGFTPKEINESTKAINQLSIAFDSGLAETAQIVAGTINGFKLEAEDAAKVSDIFAKAAATSALTIEKIGVAMANVAPASEAANISLETTTAIVGKLVDQNIDASSASTGLRNVLLELASANSKLGKELGMTVNNEEDLFIALEKLAEGGIDNAKAMIEAGEATGALGMVAELTGKRTAIALLSIVKSREAIQEQSLALQESAGFLDEYASVMEGTTKIALDRLTSSAEGFAITLFTELRPVLNAIIFLIIKLFSTLQAGVQLIRDYKELFIGLAIAMASFKVQSILAAAAQLRLGFAMKRSLVMAKNLRVAQQALNKAMRANPIGFIITGLLALAGALKFAERWTSRYAETQSIATGITETATFANTQLDGASKLLAETQEHLNDLTETEVEVRLQAVKATRLQVQARIEEIRVANLAMAQTAGSLTLLQEVGSALAFMGGGAIGASTRLNMIADNIIESTKAGNDEIKALLEGLSRLDLKMAQFADNLKDREKKRVAKALAMGKQAVKDSVALAVWRLEQQAKTQQAELDKMDEFNDDFVELAQDLSATLIQIEVLKRDALLAQENLTADGRLLIISKSTAKMAELAAGVSKQINDQMITDLNKLGEAIDLVDFDDPEDEDTSKDDEAKRDRLFANQHRRQVKAFKDLEELRATDVNLTEEQYVAKLTAIQDEYEANIIQGLKNIFGSSVEIWELETAFFKRKNDEKVKDAKGTWKQIGSFAMEAFNISTKLASDAAQRQVEDSEFRIERRSAELDRDLELAGDNAALKDELRKQAEIDINAFELRRREALIKQAKIEKAVALVSIAVNTAKAIMATAAQLGFPAATPFVIGAGVLGAVQLAAAASQPIPEFYKGTDNAPGGPAHLAERGSEISITPSGEIKYHDKPTVEHVEKGTKVLTHQKTQMIEQMLRQNNTVGTSDRALQQMAKVEQNLSKELAGLMLDGNKEVIKAVKDMERFSFEGTARGMRAYASSAKGRIELLNNRYG